MAKGPPAYVCCRQISELLAVSAGEGQNPDGIEMSVAISSFRDDDRP